ncbi:Conserved_hypothetical protein [Hexamita inflata]|uniref:Uncharacterized protein n=1 Tax=Hexamita inflata TaxID=28002 RepID=A0AA86UTC7_9EUKA|nr:Conserved hypothetical protein [Hexamita inflata]
MIIDICQLFRNQYRSQYAMHIIFVGFINKLVDSMSGRLLKIVKNPHSASEIPICTRVTESYLSSCASTHMLQIQININKNIRDNTTMLAKSIMSNTSVLENYINQNSSVLDQRIQNNISALNFSLTNTTENISQNLQAIQYNLTTLDNFTKTFQQNQNKQNQEMKQVLTSLQQQINCLNNDGKIIEGFCLANYTVNCSENSSCSQLIHVSSVSNQYFVTYSILTQSNFSSGYVFNTSQIIQNSLIDVSDNIYSANVKPLFQSQSTFTNLKIQLGVQILNSGSFLSAQKSLIIINQMNLVSRSGSQLTVSANSQLNIFTNSLTGATINNLLVNLSFAPSSGNITLINNINGVFNISGYQVLGNYISTLTVAMIGINVQTATINVNQVSFKPTTYNVGNGSSYLFGSSVSAASTLLINNLAVVIGNSSNFLLFSSIQTTQSNKCMFGGIIVNIAQSISVSIYNIIINSYHKFNTSFVSESGFLIGNTTSIQSNISINNLCIQQYITSSLTNFHNFGLIGWTRGNTSLYNASISLFVEGAQFGKFGIIGCQHIFSIYAEVINLRTFVSISSSNQQLLNCVGFVFGDGDAKNCSIQNTSVIGGNISSGSQFVGGIIGYQQNNVTILNSSVQNSNISGSRTVGGIIGILSTNQNVTIMNTFITNTNIKGESQLGGIIGRCSQMSQLYLTNTHIKFVRISGISTYFGVVVGSNQGGILQFMNSTASSNYINGVKQTECASLSNTWSISGC